MPVERTSPYPDEEVTQLHLDEMLWNINSQLPPSNVVHEGMFPPDDQINRIYNETLHLLDLEVHDRGGLESGGAFVPGSSLVPTQLPVPNQLELPLGQGYGLEASGEADFQPTWEGEDAAMVFSTGPFEVQHISTASSSSGSASQQAEQRKPRKKEESGSCDVCNRWFSRRSDVRRHMNTAHRKEVHACPQCHIVCSRKDALHRHIRDQH